MSEDLENLLHRLKERGVLSQATVERARRMDRLLELMGLSLMEQIRELAKEAGVELSDLDADVLTDSGKRAALAALFGTEEEREEAERVDRRLRHARAWLDRKKALREAKGGDEGPEDPEGDPDKEDMDDSTDPNEPPEEPE